MQTATLSLVDKFDSVTLSTEDQLPKEDLEFCIKEQSKLDEVLKQLDEKQTIFKEWLVTENNSCYDTRSYGSGSVYVEKKYSHYNLSEDDPEHYDIFKFTVQYPILHIDQLRRKVQLHFITRVIRYFNSKYCLDLTESAPEEDQIGYYANYEVLVEKMKDHLGGVLDFKASGIRKAFDDFRQHVRWRRPVIKNKVMEFDDYAWEFKNGNVKASEDCMKVLDAAISIFEREEVIPDFVFSGTYSDGIDHVLNLDKVHAIRIFRNRKLQIKFVDPVNATQFFNRFQLDTLNEV